MDWLSASGVAESAGGSGSRSISTVTLPAAIWLEDPIERVTDWVAGLQEYLTVKDAAWPVDWLVIRKPLRTIGCVVHGLAAMPQPEGAGGWLSAKSS